MKSQRNWGARYRDLMYQGMRLIELENEKLRVGILAGKGADIIAIEYKPTGIDLIWLAPGGVRNPSSQTVAAPDANDVFRETYPGGWQELFPNAGPPSTVGNVLHRQHGEIFNRPWDVEIVTDTESSVAVRFSIETRKVPCRIEKTISLRANEASFRIDETLLNLSPVPVPVMWGHHITFGYPYLEPGMRVTLPEELSVVPQVTAVSQNVRRVSGTSPFAWPIDPGNGVDFREIPGRGTPSEMLFITGFPDQAWYEIASPGTKPTCRIAWDGARMPILWFWQEFGNTIDYPWYGRLEVIGLEPCTSMPGGIANAIASGMAPVLEPWSPLSFWLTCTIGL